MQIPIIILGLDKLSSSIIDVAKKHFPHKFKITQILTRHHEENVDISGIKITENKKVIDELITIRREMTWDEIEKTIVIPIYSPEDLSKYGPEIIKWFNMIDAWGFENAEEKSFLDYLKAVNTSARKTQHLAICGVSSIIIDEKLKMSHSRLGRKISMENCDPVTQTASDVLVLAEILGEIKEEIGPCSLGVKDIQLKYFC
jgi:hypothetical protein